MPVQSRIEVVSTLPAPHPMTALSRSSREGRCLKCGATTYYVCSACTLSAFYCTPDHMLEDWNKHGRKCETSDVLTVTDAGLYGTVSDDDWVSSLATLSINEHYAAPRAPVPAVACRSYRTVLGLYANPDADCLSLVDIPVITDHRYRVGSAMASVAFVAPFVGRKNVVETIVSFGDDLQPRPSPLAFYFNVENNADESRPNACIAALVDTYPGSPQPWSGGVVVMRGSDDLVSDFCDIEESDVVDIRGFFGRLQ